MSQPDDRPAVVVSHPKSGRTWLRFMLAHALSDRPVETLRHCAIAVPDAEAGSSPTGVAVTHEPARLDHASRGVLLLRDPGEILVSFWFHATEHRATGRFDGSLSDFLDSDLGVPNLATFLRNAIDRLDREPLILTYDELITDAQAALTQAISGLGHEPDPDRVAAACAAGAFESLRAIEAAGPINDRFDADRPNRNRVRVGRADRGADVLDAAARDTIADRLRGAVGPDLARLRARVPADWAL